MSEGSEAAAALPLRRANAFSLLDQLAVSLLWFALFANWLTVVPVIVPDQIAAILGPDAAAKEGIAGTIQASGAFIALVMAPLAGALSDRARHPQGRRRPFLVAGMIGTCIGLALLVPFGPGRSIWLYALVILNLQFWWNWACGPYAGLIPDVVPPTEQARASAWMNIMSILGTFVGNGIAVLLYTHGRPGPAIAGLILINLACLWLTVKGVHEMPASGPRRRLDLGPFLRSFWLSPDTHQSFYWVLVTRLFANLGVWSVLTFLLFYLRDVIGVAEPDKILPMLLGLGAVLGIPASLIAARLVERHGVLAIVKATSWMMAGAAIAYVLIAFRPGLWLTVPVFLVYFAGWGAYQAVDWALALRVLPHSETAGKDMGIWHVALVLPQILGPALTGWIITGAKLAVSARFAYSVAFAIAALWFSLSAIFVARVRLRPGAESRPT
ncbi:MAG TPA: MFS transporter [Stellaceae bacterium]|jgi:Na+/melibiose symporter-like transporter